MNFTSTSTSNRARSSARHRAGSGAQPCAPLFALRARWLGWCAVTVIASSGCAGLPRDRAAAPPLLGAVTYTIAKGRTTEADVVRMFSAPVLVNQDAAGREHWHFTGLVFSVSVDPATGEATFWNGRGSAAAAPQPFDLTVTFSPPGIVTDYRISPSAAPGAGTAA